MDENTKVCKRCNTEKSIDEFRKHTKWYKNKCRSCENELLREYYKNHREERKEAAKKCYRKRYLQNPEKVRKKARERYKKNPEIILAYNKNWRNNNLEKARAINKNWRTNNLEKSRSMVRECGRKYHLKNKLNSQYRLNNSMKRELWRLLKINGGSKRGRSWEKIVGYSLSDLKAHLEKQFKPGMNWDNYGKWHVDHITPKSVFNFNEVGQIDFVKCWSLSNLQPLWAKDNLTKNNKLEKSFQSSFAI